MLAVPAKGSPFCSVIRILAERPAFHLWFDPGINDKPIGFRRHQHDLLTGTNDTALRMDPGLRRADIDANKLLQCRGAALSWSVPMG